MIGSAIFWAPQFLAGLTSTLMAFYLWRRRSTPGAKILLVLMLATAEWAFLSALHKASPDLSTKILIAKIQYLGIVTVPPTLLVFVLWFTGRERWLTGRNLALLAVLPAITLALAWTNEAHGLIWKRIWIDYSGSIPIGVYHYGTFFWIEVSFSYLAVFLSIIFLIMAFIDSPRFYRLQVLIMLIGIAAPLVVNGLYLLNISPWPLIDLTPIAFTVSGLALGYGMFSVHILEIMPMAHATVFNRIPDGIIVLDDNKRIINLNPAARKILCLPNSGIIGQSALQIFANHPALIENLGDMAEVHLEITLGEAGTQHSYDLFISPFKDNHGNLLGRLVTLHDLTQRKQAEEALRKSEEKLARSKKMESLGLLAGGVAHDLNNVLAGIASYPQLILMGLPEDSKLRKPIETMQESGKRAVAVVQDLLTVARGVAITKQPLNLNDLVVGYLHSPEFNKLKKFHPAVTVKTNLDSNILNISGYHVHIGKVVMNLVSNASEAVQGSGNVTISTFNCYVDRPLKRYDDVNIGEYVVLSVSDDGPGISTGDLERIFEPFFTKKVMGRSGTGLGLAVVWNIVQDHNGYIDVTSDENSTTFDLYFPITRHEISDKALSIPIEDYKGNQETILVVDDVETQREILCNMLDTLGYKTEAVSSGEEAVQYLKENTVDLIVLDMIMDPGINGCETYKRVIEIHPKQKAIIASGFAETDEVKEAQKLGAGQYIKKPVTLEEIGLAVKEELKK